MHTIAWMNLNYVILKKLDSNVYMISFIRNFQKKQISRERKHISGWGGLQIAEKIRDGKQRRKGKI